MYHLIWILTQDLGRVLYFLEVSISLRSYRIRVDPKPNEGRYPHKRKEMDPQRYREKAHLKIKAKISIILPQAKKS